MKRIFFVSSTRSEWFDNQDPEEHVKAAPYSVDAIGYNLHRLGWTVAWAGWTTTRNPFCLAKRIDEFKPDVIYTYGALVSLHPIFCRRFLCRHTAFKVVHGWDDHYERIWGEMFGWLGRVFMSWLQKRIILNSDAVVTLSFALQKLGASWGVNCHYIPNGADEIDASRVQGEIRLEGRFNLVYTGDKAKWKRTAEICEAMRHVPKDIKLYLTGRKEMYLNAYASENCIFLGWLSKEEQWNVMRQADAFVVTADQDCNAKLQEYLRWKKPILGYDGEANNFFKNGRTAILTRDYPSAILRLANDSALCRDMAARATEEIPVHTWLEIAGLFECLFEKLTKDSRNGH